MLAALELVTLALAAQEEREVVLPAEHSAVHPRAIPGGKRPASTRHFLLRGDNRTGTAVARLPRHLAGSLQAMFLSFLFSTFTNERADLDIRSASSYHRVVKSTTSDARPSHARLSRASPVRPRGPAPDLAGVAFSRQCVISRQTRVGAERETATLPRGGEPELGCCKSMSINSGFTVNQISSSQSADLVSSRYRTGVQRSLCGSEVVEL